MKTHGGSRKGAGAKPKKKKKASDELITRAYCLTQAQVRRIEKEAKALGSSRSSALRSILG